MTKITLNMLKEKRFDSTTIEKFENLFGKEGEMNSISILNKSNNFEWDRFAYKFLNNENFENYKKNIEPFQIAYDINEKIENDKLKEIREKAEKVFDDIMKQATQEYHQSMASIKKEFSENIALTFLKMIDNP